MDRNGLQRMYLRGYMRAKDGRSDDDLGLVLGTGRMVTLSLGRKAGWCAGSLGCWLGRALGDWVLSSPLDALGLGISL